MNSYLASEEVYDLSHDSHSRRPSSRSGGKKQLILDFLYAHRESFFPREIAEKLGLKPSTVRNYLRILHRDGLVKRLEGGRYCSNDTYGVLVPLRVHNLRFRVVAPYLRDMEKIPDVDEFYGGVHLKIQFGKSRGLITGFISYDRGLDYAHVSFLMRRVYELIERKTGRKIERFTVTSLEWNRDYYGKRLDSRSGIMCFTLREFDDFLVRVYQKGENAVRVEAKTSRELSLEELLEIQRTGSIGYLRDGEIINNLIRRMEAQEAAIKWMNRKLVEINAKLEKIIETKQNRAEPLSRLAELSSLRAEETKKRTKPTWII